MLNPFCPNVIVHDVGVDTEFLGGDHAVMELAALAYLAGQLEQDGHPLAWIARVALDGRQPTDAGVHALYDRLADVLDLDQQLGA
jgi:hypothetical protein